MLSSYASFVAILTCLICHSAASPITSLHSRQETNNGSTSLFPALGQPIGTLGTNPNPNVKTGSSGGGGVVKPVAISSNPITNNSTPSNSPLSTCANAPETDSQANGGTALKKLSFKVQTATLCTDPNAGLARSYNPCNCAAQKQTLFNLGADSLDMAIAFLEVGQGLSADYPYGDNKQEDSANFSIFKYNWWMIRTACSQFAGQQQSDWNNGAVLNTDDAAAIVCLREQLAHFGDSWWGGQRQGSSGVGKMDGDITTYKNGAQSIQNWFADGHMTDDTGAYSVVPPIK